jgi:hypothetical protein
VKEGVHKGAEPEARKRLPDLGPHPHQGGEGVPEPCQDADPTP